MVNRLFSRAGKTLLPLLCIMNMFLLISPVRARGEASVPDMRGYCNLPPLPGLSVKPNLLLMIDNSASMYDLAYTDPSRYCVDDSADTYEKGEQYPGYFDQGTFYSYNFQKDAAGNETGYFQAAAAANIPPSSRCNALRKDFACVNIASGKLDHLLASGRFLNWLSLSKLDIEKMALTGGKFDPATGLLQAETRGCQGSRFVKMIGDSPITFAVRGPIPSESDYLDQVSHGGLTRIEIYARPYNKDACGAAVAAWQQGTVAELKVAADSCMGNVPDAEGVPSNWTIYNSIMADCYTYQASSPPDEELLYDETLLSDCGLRIWAIHGDNPEWIPRNNGEDICGKNILHVTTQHSGFTSGIGYLGQCYDPMYGFDPICSRWQTKDYCDLNAESRPLTDPSVTATKSGTNANVPGFVLDAGIHSLGEVSGTVLARIALASPPSGLIQEFSNEINFGAMVFNDNGAGSECGAASGIPCVKHCTGDPPPQRECQQVSDCINATSGSCSEDPRIDGGKVISYLNHSPLGDHNPNSGLIASIDRVRANSWTPLAESFYEAIGYFANDKELRLNETDFDISRPPSMFSCQKNNILMITDGTSTADRAQAVNAFVAAGWDAWVNGDRTMPASQTTGDPVSAQPPYRGSYNLDDLAWIARNKNISDFDQPRLHDKDYVSTYVVYSGAPCGAYKPDGTCSTSNEGVPEKMMQLVASKGGGRMARAQEPAELAAALRNMLQLIGTGSNSATDASILSGGDGNGTLFLQEQFFRNKSFDGGTTSASWIGEMQGLWYYIDPLIGSTAGASTIREDSEVVHTLDLKKDRVVRFSFSADRNQTWANLYRDADGDGAEDRVQPEGYPLTVNPDEVRSLWRAGLKLWQREPATRAIYTHTDGKTLIGLTSNGTAPTALDLSKSAHQRLLQAENEAEAASIVSFVQGTDSAPATRDRGVIAAGSAKQVWKLGDIISSTPVLQSATRLGSYQLPSPRGYSDASYTLFTKTPAYKSRGTVYVGANDGMLHAFRLGSLKTQPEGGETRWPASKKAVLSGTELGKEEWAFIPTNALPYLRYLKEPLYPHLYYVDGSSTLADVSLGLPGSCNRESYWNCPKDFDAGKNWRTVLIGGMGLGGASQRANDLCIEGAAGTCVKAPAQTDGLSSYFALDVTGQSSDGEGPPPRLLWEFSAAGLGYATSGAAIVKINARADTDPAKHDPSKNGRWFAVFASGPTGPIDTSSCQFLGKSDQNLKLFVVDLNAVAPLSKGDNYWVIDTGIANAFGGGMTGAAIDTDKWNPKAQGYYEDDALYVGYTRLAQDGSWTGGVQRLFTNENPNPGQWTTSTVIDGIGPVTGGIAKLQDRANKNLWLYFGTGRYFHNGDDLTADRALFGVKEPCYTADNALVDDGKCSKKVLGLSDLVNASDLPDPPAPVEPLPPDAKGWWIGLEPPGVGLASERHTGNPTAVAGGSVFFTTFKPSTDLCLQGVSYLWGVKYDNGGSIPISLNGQALMSLSNGSSSEFLLSGLSEMDGRRSQGMTGKAGGVKLITNRGLRPLRKIMHVQER